MESVRARNAEILGDEDVEGGLDEDWVGDVDVIELQSKIPAVGNGSRSGKGKVKGGASTAAAAAAVENPTARPPPASSEA